MYLQMKFDTQSQFRVLAPRSVAQGMLSILDRNSKLDKEEVKARMMDLIIENTPKNSTTVVTRDGSKTTEQAAYKATFTDSMLKEVDAFFNELSVTSAHSKRVSKALNFLRGYTPTLSLSESLYRLSFYLIPNKNNLAKSTNNLISFTSKLLSDSANNILVDSAILLGGQGKSTVQKGLLLAAEKLGLATSSCNLPSYKDGVQEVFVKNEICIDEDSKFEKIDYEDLNKIADKQQITIKGKYIKEWSAKSVANLLVGTNFLPQDINARRYAIRMVDEGFKLEENFGRWTIPGVIGETQESYSKVVDWTAEAWLNLIYYTTKYKIKKVDYKERSFDYGIVYKIQKALGEQPSNTATINELLKFIEQTENDGEPFRGALKESMRNKLYMLANQLKLPIVGTPKKHMYNTYDWTAALEIDEITPGDSLEFIKVFFDNEECFKMENLEEIESELTKEASATVEEISINENDYEELKQLRNKIATCQVLLDFLESNKSELTRFGITVPKLNI